MANDTVFRSEAMAYKGYTWKVQVSGVLIPTQGLTKITSPQIGLVTTKPQAVLKN
jgi:hypothetical protein